MKKQIFICLLLMAADICQAQAVQELMSAKTATKTAKTYYNYYENGDNVYNAAMTHKQRYFHVCDTTMAMNYVRQALQADSTYADAYLLAADIFDYDGYTQQAIEWLRMGQRYNQDDERLVEAEAEIEGRKDMGNAIDILFGYSIDHYSYPLYRTIARLYDKLDLTGVKYREEVANNYARASMNTLTHEDMDAYVQSLYYSGKVAECLNVAKEALKQYPEDLTLNRFCFISAANTKDYQMAYDSYEHLAALPGYTAVRYDSISLAGVLVGLHRFSEAENLLDTLQAKDDLSVGEQRNIGIFANRLMDERVSVMKEDGRYKEATKLYAKYVKQLRAAGKLTDSNVMTQANIYFDWAAEKKGWAKKRKLMKADKLLASRIVESELNKDFFAYIRLAKVYFQLDPNAKKGTAIPFVEQMERIILSKDSIENVNKQRLVTGYRYMMSYYFVTRSDIDRGMEYAEKILSLAPDNEAAATLKNYYERHKRRKGVEKDDRSDE